MRDGGRAAWVGMLWGALAPLAAAAALIPLRHDIDNANVALALAAVVAAVALTGRRAAVLVAALSGTVWFDLFHTKPYGSLTITNHNDVVTAGVLLLVGVLVGELAIRSRRHRSASQESNDDIARIHAVAELVAAGEDPEHVVTVVATELRQLLGLRDCRFEPAGALPPATGPARAVFERNGEVVLGELRWGAHSMGLPGKEVELAVTGRGRVVGSFILVPTPGRPVSLVRRVVAVALADQAGASLSAHPAAGVARP